MDRFNIIVFSMNKSMQILTMIFALVTPVFSFLIRKQFKQLCIVRLGKILGRFLFYMIYSALIVLSVMFMIAIWYAQGLVEVPNVEGLLYADAKNVLIKRDLGFNVQENAENKMVISQSLQEGKIVLKNTKVNMELKEADNSFDLVEEKLRVVAIDPGCVGGEFDEEAMDELGPGAEESSRSYTNGGVGETTGIREYEINLEVGNRLKDILNERGYEVIMTREDNRALSSSKERALMANESGADIFVRVFCRKQQDNSERGAMVYVPSKNNPYIKNLYKECHSLGNYILGCYCSITDFENAGLRYTDETKGINWSKIPVAQIMLGCINDIEDEQKLANPGNWDLMAEGIANGIDAYFNKNLTF